MGKESRSWFGRLRDGLAKTRTNLVVRVKETLAAGGSVDEDLFEALEEALIKADAGVDTTLAVIGRVREQTAKEKIKDPKAIQPLLERAMAELLEGESLKTESHGDESLLALVVVGVNGAGKTTTVGKLAARFSRAGKRVVVGAADTFRAAAIDQVGIWAERAGADLIAHQEGSDPAAVAYDAVHAARAREADVLIVDTAGRLQTKTNLMQELGKVYRVIQRELGREPDESLLVLDATTGQNALSQGRLFKEAVPLTGIALTKLDGTAKGGIVLAVNRELGLPVKLIGIGEGVEDLRDFEAQAFVEALFETAFEAERKT